MSQRALKDFVKIMNQMNSEKVPEGLKLPNTFSQLVSDMKNNKYSSKEFALILKGMVCAHWFYLFIFHLVLGLLVLPTRPPMRHYCEWFDLREL